MSKNNATGFSALPAGRYTTTYYNFGLDAHFWSATETASTHAYNRNLFYTTTNVNRGNINKNAGFSVRCVCDRNGRRIGFLL